MAVINRRSLEDLSNAFAFIDWARKRGVNLDQTVIKHGAFEKLCHSQALIEILENPYVFVTDEIINVILQESGLSTFFVADEKGSQIRLNAVK